MSKRLTPTEQVDVISAFEVNLEPMISIAKRYGITRQGVCKLLKRAGIDTTTHKIAVSCSCCQAQLMRPKSQIRSKKNMFCDFKCYYAFLEAGQQGSYTAWRQGSRIARAKVSKLFDLKPEHRVHHADRNTYNNELWNLMVFANQGDHVRYHRLGPDSVIPLWDGSKD